MSGTKRFSIAKDDELTGYVVSICPFCGKVNEVDVADEFKKTCKHFIDMEWEKNRCIFDRAVMA
jgi:hypothetical protein